MATAARTSFMSVLTVLAGLSSLVCGFLSLMSDSDSFLLRVVLFFALSMLCGLLSWVGINRAGGRLHGKGFAACGMGMPLGGFALGFLLLPQV